MTPVVWVGSRCGVVVDALPGTYAGDESSCDSCGDECVMVADGVSEFEVDDPDEDDAEPPEISEWELRVEAAYWREAEKDSK